MITSVRRKNFVWIDLEMTGLDPEKDHILEMATIITDDNLQILEQGRNLVIYQPDTILELMDPFVKQMHIESDLYKAVQESTLQLSEAIQETSDLIKKYCAPQVACLAGNSIWQDRRFLQKFAPDILAYLNYRMIDVTSIKELVTRWFPHSVHALFMKRETHRALDDIIESIQELAHYRHYFFKQ